MDIPASCQSCGLKFVVPNFFSAGPGAKVIFEDNVTSCPRCGRLATMENATYEFDLVGQVLRNIRGQTRKDIEAFHSVLERFKEGDITTEEAEKLSSEINPVFDQLWKWLGSNSG